MVKSLIIFGLLMDKKSATPCSRELKGEWGSLMKEVDLKEMTSWPLITGIKLREGSTATLETHLDNPSEAWFNLLLGINSY